jgi:hypothetical protein
MPTIPGNPARPRGLFADRPEPAQSAPAQAVAVPDKTFRRRLYETPSRRRNVIASGSGSSAVAGATAADCQRQTSCVPIRDQRQVSGGDRYRRGCLDGIAFGRKLPGRLSLAGMAPRRPGAMPSDRTSRNFASFWNIAHLRFPRCAAAGERSGRLSAATNPHAATAVATDLDVLRQRRSDRNDRTNVALGSTAHLLFIRVEVPVPDGMSRTAFCHVSRGGTGVKGFAISRREDGCYPPGRIVDSNA